MAAAGGQRIVGLELDHGPDDHAKGAQRLLQRLELRVEHRVDALARLVAGPEGVPKRLDDVVGGHAHVRRPLLEHPQDGRDHAAHPSQLLGGAPAERGRRREEVAEQLEGPVDEMDDHAWNHIAGERGRTDVAIPAFAARDLLAPLQVYPIGAPAAGGGNGALEHVRLHELHRRMESQGRRELDRERGLHHRDGEIVAS